MRLVILLAVTCIILGCESMEYGIKEQFGIEKRDIMVARVSDAAAAQEDAKTQFRSALDEFSAVVSTQGGDLEDLYDDLGDALSDSESRATAVTARINEVERVSKALFDEWSDELEEYASAQLRRSSERKLATTQTRYKDLMGSMRRAESRMEPVLIAFRDQVLYLKHNLNAKAVAALESELVTIEKDVARLVSDMEASIRQSMAFIEELEAA